MCDTKKFVIAILQWEQGLLCDKSSFLHAVYKVNFDILETISDTNLFLDKLYMLNCVLDKHAPLKYKRTKRLQQPGRYMDEAEKARITRDTYRSYKKNDISIKSGEISAFQS